MSNIPFDEIMKNIFTPEDNVNVSKVIKNIIADAVLNEFGYNIRENLNDKAFDSDELKVDDFKGLIAKTFLIEGAHTAIKHVQGLVITGEISEDDEKDMALKHLDVVKEKADEIFSFTNKLTTQITAICVKALETMGHMVIGQEINFDDSDDERDDA